MRGGDRGEGRGGVGLVAAALVAAVLAAGTARAQADARLDPGQSAASLWPTPGEVALTYELGKGTSGCEGEAAFRKWVASRMEQRDPFVASGDPPHTLRVRLERRLPGIAGVLELRDRSGALLFRREALERECSDLVDRLVLLVTLSVFAAPVPSSGTPACDGADAGPAGCAGAVAETEGGAGARRDARPPHLDGPPAEVLVADIASLQQRVGALELSAARDRPPDIARGLSFTPGRTAGSFTLSAGPLFTAGLTSEVGPGFWLGAEAYSRPFSLGLEVRAALPSRVSAASPGAGSPEPADFDLSQIAAVLAPCAGIAPFSGCLVAALGAEIRHDAEQPPERRTATSPFLGLGARVAVEIPFGRSRLAARVWADVLYTVPRDVRQPSPRPPAEYTDSPPRWDRPDLSLAVGTGLVVHLGGDASP